MLENNGWAESTPAAQQLPLAVEDMEHRALAYGMEHIEVDGQDVEAVYPRPSRRASTRSPGQGPVFMNVRTFRLHRALRRRPAGLPRQGGGRELRETHDPIERLRARLGSRDDEFEALDAEVQAEVDGVGRVREGRHRPDPEDALEWVYA